MVHDPAAARPVRVIVADDDESLRLWLRHLITATDGLELVGEAADAAAAVELARTTGPDIAIVDVRMPRGGGPEATQLIGMFSRTTKVVAFSAYATQPQILSMIEAGASGYLVKGGDPGEIIAAVRTVAGGDVYLPPQVNTALVGYLHDSLVSGGQRTLQRSRTQHLVDDVLAERALTMHYQPIVELGTGRIIGYEALARINSPRRQPPDKWFTDAAEVGKLAQLEHLAISTALAQFGQLPRDTFLAINITPETATAHDLDVVFADAPLERIVLEVTEHTRVADYTALANALDPLRSRGLRIAIDDVGAGYSNMSHVVQLAPEIIKLDRSLTARIENNQGQRSLIAAMRTFAADTRSDLLAEGIETPGELETMHALGVTLGQGYLLGRPAPMETLERTGPRRGDVQ